jgi:hypothetical protein
MKTRNSPGTGSLRNQGGCELRMVFTSSPIACRDDVVNGRPILLGLVTRIRRRRRPVRNRVSTSVGLAGEKMAEPRSTSPPFPDTLRQARKSDSPT